MPEMEKSARVGVVGRLLRMEPRVAAAGLHARPTPSSCEVTNDKSPSLHAGNSNGGRKIHHFLAQGLWPNTFRLDPTTLGKPIGQVTRQKCWKTSLGQPVEQTVPDTCALVACTMCLEAKHRLEYEKLHGEGTFPCRAVALCDMLISRFFHGVWAPGEGAYVGAVLTRIQQMGGVPATTTDATAPAPCVLPLRSWQKHRWDSYDSDSKLSPERVAALLDNHGPCVGVLWVCPWYQYFDAGRDDELVYRGCGRDEGDRDESLRLYNDKGMVGSHAVVCFGYRFCGDQMHVLVRDNHDAAANGPERWIDVEELDTLYTLSVDRLNHPMASG